MQVYEIWVEDLFVHESTKEVLYMIQFLKKN
jgi:hypothetical protein